MLSNKKLKQMFDIGYSKTFSKEPAYQEFIKVAQVRKTNELVPLTEFSKEKRIKTSDIILLYDLFRNRFHYLEQLYHLSFEPRQLSITDAPMTKSHWNNNTKNQYKNIIRNMHFLNIFYNTESAFGVPTLLRVLKDFFLEGIIYYKFFTPSAITELRLGGNYSFISSSFFRISSHASVMNPYLVYSINQKELDAVRVFSPTLGWSSYCYGFLECPRVIEYVGTDVIPRVCATTETFARKNYPGKTTRIFCQPSQELLYDRAFMQRYRSHFDTVFFSPPYYQLELYPGKMQSTETYKTYEEWLEGYWHPTIELCYRVLKRGGKMCYILSDYGESNGGDLMRDMGKIAKEWFIPFRKYGLSSNMKTGETVFIFSKES